MASSEKYSSGKKSSKAASIDPSKKLTTILSKEAEKSSSIKAEVYSCTRYNLWSRLVWGTDKCYF